MNKYGKLAAKEAADRLRESGIALLPVGAVEAHGPHLPLETDNVLAERVAEKLSEKVNAMILPPLNYGQVWSLQNFPGSLSISNDTLIHFIRDIGVSLERQGARIFAMVNGHVGNMPALKEAARLLYEQTDLKVYYFTYPGTKEVVDRVRESKPAHGSYFHACEIETSYMLYLAPNQVDMERAVRDEPVFPDDFDTTPIPWEHITETGVLGDATLASREKGQAIIDTTVDHMAAILLKAKRNLNTEEST